MEVCYYPSSVMERAMKIQEVILRAIDGRLKRYQAQRFWGFRIGGYRKGLTDDKGGANLAQ